MLWVQVGLRSDYAGPSGQGCAALGALRYYTSPWPVHPVTEYTKNG